MPLRVVCCYSHLSTREAVWEDAHYCVKKFKDAIKGGTINKWADLKIDDGPRRRLEQDNIQDAIKWFGEMMAPILSEWGFRSAPVFVPIPNSKCDVKQPSARTSKLALAAAQCFAGSVRDGLRFDKPMPSASAEGGSRQPEDIFQHLRWVGPLPTGRPYVLVDDVVTSGGHLRAAKAFMESLGVSVVLGIGGVSADREPSPTPFERVWREFEDFDPPAK